MNNFINYNWTYIKNLIIFNQINWNYLVDSINYPIHFLTYHNQLDLIKLINPLHLFPNKEGDSVLHISAKLFNFDLFFYFLNIDFDLIYDKNNMNYSPLYYLIEKDSIIKKINKIEDHFISDITLLDYYILTQNKEMIKFLSKNLIFNELSNQSIFGLFNFDEEYIIYCLSILPLNINILDNNYKTPLILAIEKKFFNLTKYLIDKVDINYFGLLNDDHPLTIAIKNKDINIIKLLMKTKIKNDIPNKDLETPIHYLFYNPKDFPLKIKRKLIKNIDINLRNKNKESILDLIINNDNYDDYKDILIEKTESSIELINTPKVNITNYMGNNENYICFLIYLLRKYPEIKIPYYESNKKIKDIYLEMKTKDPLINNDLREFINHSPILINHIILWRNKENYFISPTFFENIKCNAKFVIIKLLIITDVSNHANIIIYDINKKIIERFDPYGNILIYDNDTLNDFLKNLFEKNLDVKYLSPKDTAGNISFQIYSNEQNITNQNDPPGFCLAWTIWYIETRIKNEIEPKELIKKTIKQINKNEEKFKDYIRNYSEYINKKKNKILEENGIPKKYWYSYIIPQYINRRYLINIRKIFKNFF